MNSPVPLLASTGSLLLGGSTTFLLNLGRAFRERNIALPVVSLTEETEMTEDFATAGVTVHQIPRRMVIYEDRVRLAYLHAAKHRPTAVLACLGSESFEI